MGSNPKPSEQQEQEQQEQQEQQQHHPKPFACPHEESSCALFAEEEEEEEEEENERPDCNSCGRAHAFWPLLDLQPNLLIVRERWRTLYEIGCNLFRRFGTAHTLHLVRAVFGLPLTYIGHREGDALDDDEAGWNCGENAGLW